MNIYSIISEIESYAPRSYQEKWDNSGLQIALPVGQTECTGVLLCVDVSEAVVDEAVRRGCNLVVSHHPLIFKGFKSLTGASRQERAAIKAIRAGVAVYSAHTSLDSTRGGVSYAMASLLGAEVQSVIEPLEGRRSVLTVICPRAAASDVRLVLLDGGAGEPPVAANAESCESANVVPDMASVIYSDCESEQMPRQRGVTLDLRHEPLCTVEAVVPASSVQQLMNAVGDIPGCGGKVTFKVAEAPASEAVGLGVVALFPDDGISGAELVERLRKAFAPGAIKASASYTPDMKVRRIALCGGSGGEFIPAVKGCDAYVTADVRYHDFFDAAENHCAVLDIGHFESEACAKSIFYKLITKKFPNFAVYYSESEQNPVKYL